jgi:hypothetical protein
MGSVHNFWNWSNGKGAQNWNRFSYSDCITAIDTLSEIHGISPECQTLKGYEFGYNLNVSFDPKQIIRDNIICHRRNYSSLDRDYGINGYCKQYIFDQFRIKLYDKGKESGLRDNILRIEIKVVKSAYHIKRESLNTIHDLKCRENWHWFNSRLKSAISDLLILDDPKSKSNVDYSNPNFWKYLRQENRTKLSRRWNALSNSKIKNELIHSLEKERRRLEI